MAIDIETASKFIKEICLSYIGKTFRSTIWTSLLIVITILLIVALLYPTGKNISVGSYIKPVMYIIISTLIILFIHDSCMKDEHKVSIENQSAENVIGGIKMFRDHNSDSQGVYEAVYGKAEENVKARSHQSVGENSYVSTQTDQSVDFNTSQIQPQLAMSDESTDGKIVSITQEV